LDSPSNYSTIKITIGTQIPTANSASHSKERSRRKWNVFLVKRIKVSQEPLSSISIRLSDTESVYLMISKVQDVSIFDTRWTLFCKQTSHLVRGNSSSWYIGTRHRNIIKIPQPIAVIKQSPIHHTWIRILQCCVII